MKRFLLLAVVVALAVSASHRCDVKELRRKANQAARRSTDGSVVVVSASFDYAPVLVNWLANMERLGLRNWLVVCFDKQMRQFLARRGATSIVLCVAKRMRHQDIWLARLAILRDLVSKGIPVTLSDLDAMWLKDATPYLHVADVVASRGTHPTWASDAWGAALCMGLVRFNPHSEAFVNLFLQRKGITDDQCALNAGLKMANITWTTALPLPFVNSSTTDTGMITVEGITVALLPHSTFVRRCEFEGRASSGVVVEHCYTPKTARSKRDSLRKRGTWIIGGDMGSSTGSNDVNATAAVNQTRFYTWLRGRLTDTTTIAVPVHDSAEAAFNQDTGLPTQPHESYGFVRSVVSWLYDVFLL